MNKVVLKVGEVYGRTVVEAWQGQEAILVTDSLSDAKAWAKAEGFNYTVRKAGSKKTATIHRDRLYGTGLKSVMVLYRNEELYTCVTLEEAKEWAKRNGFTHARYSGTFSGKDQPKAGEL